MRPDWMIEKGIRDDYLKRAKAMREAGYVVTDSDMFDTLTIECREAGILYEFKYDERENLKADQPDWLAMDFEDYLLATMVNW